MILFHEAWLVSLPRMPLESFPCLPFLKVVTMLFLV